MTEQGKIKWEEMMDGMKVGRKKWRKWMEKKEGNDKRKEIRSNVGTWRKEGNK